MAQSVQFQMIERNNSKLKGHGMLAHAEGPGGEAAVSVDIVLDNIFIPEAEYRAGVYDTPCSDRTTKAARFELNAVKGGRSTTVIFGQTIQSLEAGNYSVSVHSEKDPEEVLCCGALTPR